MKIMLIHNATAKYSIGSLPPKIVTEAPTRTRRQQREEVRTGYKKNTTPDSMYKVSHTPKKAVILDSGTVKIGP